MTHGRHGILGERPTVIAADARDPDESAQVSVAVDRWQRLAFEVLVDEEVSGELTLTFIGIDEIAALNEQFMGVEGPTDVLSFPLDIGTPDEVPTLLGDVVISPAVANAQFAEHAGTLDDELALLVVHGVLHILGHDHAEPDETAVMRSRELDLLERLHWGGAAPDGFRQHHD